MAAVICGSLAFDSIMNFGGQFADQILPDQIHKLNVSFYVPQLRREFGGCAGNIVYNLRALGGHPCLLASVGEDFAPYQAHLDALGVDSRLVRTVPGQYTAQCFITSDQADNQITAFHPGAMDNPPAAHPSAAGPLQLAILAPGGPQSTLQLADELSALGVPFMFDPGQELPLFSVEQLHALIARARWLALNDYESELLMQRTGLDVAQLAARVAGLVITRGGQGSDLYADGQHWDDTTYTIPLTATRVDVLLRYQTTTREYAEFLRDQLGHRHGAARDREHQRMALAVRLKCPGQLARGIESVLEHHGGLLG